MSRLKGVAIGAGYFSRFQYEAWTRIPEVEIVALCNRDAKKARPLMEAHGVPRHYTDFREMIEKESPDFVDVITPPETHREMCRFAAERGVHVICQKPLAPTFGEFLVEGDRGSIRLHGDGRITLQPLGETERSHDYPHEDRQFAGDCCYAIQRHFVDRMHDGGRFETNGEDYLETLAVQEAVYESAATGVPATPRDPGR